MRSKNVKRKRLKTPKIFKLADKAMKVAVRNVMIEHKLRGFPIVVWENNKIVRIPPRRIRIPPRPR